MLKYQVTVERTESVSMTFTIESPSLSEARNDAIDKAGGLDFRNGSSGDVDYKLTNIQGVKEDQKEE